MQELDFSNLIMLFLWPPLTIFLCVSISSFIHSNIYILHTMLCAYYVVVSETKLVSALREFTGEAGVGVEKPIKQVNF